MQLHLRALAQIALFAFSLKVALGCLATLRGFGTSDDDIDNLALLGTDGSLSHKKPHAVQ